MARIGLVPTVGALGALTLSDPVGNVEANDFHDVPSTDRGNADYSDRGMLGSYAPSNREPFSNPRGVKMFTGYGGSESDLERGYVEPAIRNDPAYDKRNYAERSTLPKIDDSDDGGQPMNDDYEFRLRNQRSRGFMIRPRIPTER